MGWWIALAVVVGLAILPLGVSVKYNADGVWLAIVAGPIRIKILPAKKKEKKPKKQKPKKEKKPKKDKPEKAKKPSKKTKTKPKQVPPDVPLEEKYPNLDKKPGKIPKTPPEPVKEKKEEGGSWTDFLSLVPIVLNFLTVGAGNDWGLAMYWLLILVSAPMVCGQIWALSLFGWACVMMTCIHFLRKK